MLLRTIPIHNAADEPANAAVLCSFTIPKIHRNILVYTLNEAAPNSGSKVYIAALSVLENGYRLEPLEPKHEWPAARLVLRQIVRGADHETA